MPEPKNELHHLHKILTFLNANFCAADAAADVPQTCRRHSADVAADVAADVQFPQWPESLFATISHSTAWQQILVA